MSKWMVIAMHNTLSPVNALKSVWEEYETVTLDRVALVEEAVELLIAGDLPDPEREQARRAAHLLAGSVAMFGFERSSKAASALEAALETGDAPDQAQAQTLREHAATMRTEGLEPRMGTVTSSRGSRA
jgi:HPt (histidine-containing phosphotransfer) domain-containing protein